MLKAGSVFTGLYPVGSGKDRRFIIVSDEDAGLVVWVFLSSQLNDNTVVLPAGCHPQITLNSNVVYEMACVVNAKDIHAALTANAIAQQTDLDPALLKQVQEGIFNSSETPDSVVDYCTDRI